MQLIEQWLKGSKNFIIGRTLYNRFGTDQKLKDLLAKGESAFVKQELQKALQAIVDTGVRNIVKPATRALEEMPVSFDPVLQSIAEEWKPKYMRMNLLRHKLDEYGEKNDLVSRTACHELCKQILQLEKEINFEWDRKDHYETHGRLADVKEKDVEIPTDPVKLATFIQSCLRQIRRYKPTAGNNAKHAQLRQDYILKLEKATGKPYAEKN